MSLFCVNKYLFMLFLLWQLKCCGANGPLDWAGSRYNKGDKQNVMLAITSQPQLYSVPPSCCSADPESDICKAAVKTGVAARISDLIYSEVIL